MPQRSELLLTATKYLQKKDAVLRRVIRQVGPCRLPRRRNHFATLVRAIVSQQISTSAARTIQARLETLLSPAKISPESLVALPSEQLREVGLSRQKASYLRDLAQHAHHGRLQFHRFSRLDDEQIIAELTQVKGVGRWTAEMLLIFSLGRLDVLPVDDLGVRKAIRQIYELDVLPDQDKCHEIGAAWRPYASVASWYCWRSLDS